MPAPETIRELVQRFEYNKDTYRSLSYKEAQLRQEFLDPFFEALGWDVANKKGYAPQYREVIHEDSIHIQGSPNAKAPDYAFRLGGVRKFFVEAKKPAEDIQNTKEFAYQLKIYAWNSQLPLSILTDFEGFAVYDCRIKPNLSDSPATSRIMYFTYDQYLTHWDEIASIFSPDAIRKGAFDKYAEDNTAKRGTTSVDEAFLGEIEEWRTLLARNIALRNPQVANERQLNFAVQMTIDRIIFLRICEDRGIEPEHHLLEISKNKGIYPDLVALFQKADLRYNSGLFHFKPEQGNKTNVDTFTPGLAIDDRVLKSIIKSLYYPCPYVFKEIPVEILGQVYEQFLGKVIRLTPSGQAKVEEKPEVRKAGGVYYTPKYIVDYIVENTVGELLKGKTPEEAAKLKIVDPACGSGSFLLGAFQYLMDWHEKYYLKHDPEKWTQGSIPALVQAADGDWQLTTEEKKRILVNNLYGVDIDAQAVEVTKLSLLLKVLEEETGQLTLGFERALPDLSDNIQCGNSLIDWDYFEGQLIRDEEEVARVNPFDWEQAFPGVFAKGGFDVVIGNPPYLFITEICKEDKMYFFRKYLTSEYRFDVYGLFSEKALSDLLMHQGILSFITPHTLLSNNSFEKLRNLILNNTFIIEVIDIGPNVFDSVNNETMIFIIRKSPNQKETRVLLTDSNIFPNPIKEFFIDQSAWMKSYKSAWLVKVSESELRIIDHINQCHQNLSDFCTINQGLRTGNNKKFISSTEKGDNWKPIIGGKDISRYKSLIPQAKVNYDKRKLDAPRNPEIFESTEKIVVQEVRNITLSRRIIATYDNNQHYCLQTTNVINIKDNKPVNVLFLLGIINSTAINFYFRKNFSGNNHIASYQLGYIPIPVFSRSQHIHLSGLVENILKLHNRTPQTPHEQEQLEREIAATDAQIDRLVYDLYGLTEEEIKIVEGDN